MGDSTEWVVVASVADVEEGGALGVEVNGLQLAVYHVGDAWYCTDNVCTHAFALLTDGWLEDHVIECPLHGGQFDIRTGEGLCPPIAKDVQTFPVRIEGTDVLVGLA